MTTGRQVLLERLRDPQRAYRTVGLDARRYLSYNSNDGEVREGLERLPKEYLYS